MDIDQLALDAADFVVAGDRQRQRLVVARRSGRDRLDEQLVQSARGDEAFKALVAAALQECGIGIEELIVSIDQDADRKLIEHWPRAGP